MRALTRNAGWVLIGFVALGCKASLQAEGDANVDLVNDSASSGETGMARRFDIAEEQVVVEDPLNSDAGYESPPGTALIGARHDLKISEAKRRTECRCVSAVLGQATDPAFKWLGEPAKTDPNTEVTLAFTSEGAKCDGAPAGSLGASYWGFRREGDDLVVLLEPATLGKPLTTGAILPKPTGSGQIYLAPVDPALPYGKALTGKESRCRLRRAGALVAR